MKLHPPILLALLAAAGCAPVEAYVEEGLDTQGLEAVPDTDEPTGGEEGTAGPDDTGPDTIGGPGDPGGDDTGPDVIDPGAGDDELFRDGEFTDDALPVFELTISEDALAILDEQTYEYVSAEFTYKGVTYGPVGVRTKGENSWRPFSQKASLKIDFERYKDGPGEFLGLEEITLQAMNEDYSMMHERVAYRLYREAGVAASRANHALVYVNGEYYGLFTNLETVDDRMLERWFADASGPLFEQHDGDYADKYVLNDLYFQLEEGEDDRTALQAVADALEVGGPEALAAAGLYLNWDQFLTYWAVGAVVMQYDAYPYRYAGDDAHVYVDPTSGQIHYLPHGVDESFYYDSYYHMRDSAAGHLSARCLEVEECRDQFAEKLYDVLDIADAIDLYGYAQAVADQIRPWAVQDMHKQYPMSYVNAYQDDMLAKIAARRDRALEDVGPRPSEKSGEE